MKDRLIGHKHMVSQDRWSWVTGSFALKCRTFCQNIVVFRDSWSLMAVASQDRFYCSWVQSFPIGEHFSRKSANLFHMKHHCGTPQCMLFKTVTHLLLAQRSLLLQRCTEHAELKCRHIQPTSDNATTAHQFRLQSIRGTGLATRTEFRNDRFFFQRKRHGFKSHPWLRKKIKLSWLSYREHKPEKTNQTQPNWFVLTLQVWYQRAMTRLRSAR